MFSIINRAPQHGISTTFMVARRWESSGGRLAASFHHTVHTSTMCCDPEVGSLQVDVINQLAEAAYSRETIPSKSSIYLLPLKLCIPNRCRQSLSHISPDCRSSGEYEGEGCVNNSRNSSDESYRDTEEKVNSQPSHRGQTALYSV